MQNVSENNEWFKTWFDSPYYHQLYKDRNDKEAQLFLRNLLAKLDPPPHAKILDLACGRGRHSRYLNTLGYDVLGADLSQASIDWAKQFENDSLHFLVHDMRHVIKGAQFSCIFNLFTSFGYFSDKKENAKVLQSVREMLDDRGCFVIDFLNVSKIIKTIKEKEVKSVEGLDFSIQRKIADGMIVKKISFSDRGSQFKFREQVQALDLDDFKEMMDETNFRIVGVYGDYMMNSYDIENSDRLILICKKKNK
jgi:SAM-dependent methyltransferase